MPPRRRRQRPLTLRSSHWRADGQAKVRYPSRAEAASAAAHQGAEAGIELGVYRCDFCSGWHMGRPGARENDDE